MPEEGILKGKEGELKFKRVSDGYAVSDSTLLNSDFVYPGSCDGIYVPHTINGIPVVELHQTVVWKTKRAFSIEHGNLQRLSIKVESKFAERQRKNSNQ